MDSLPVELQFHILSFLTIEQRFKMRRVCRSFKQMSESSLKTVKRMASEKRDLYSPMHTNCCVRDTEICASIIRPQPLICVLSHCPNIQCLFIGRIPTHYTRFWGWGVYYFPPPPEDINDVTNKRGIELAHQQHLCDARHVQEEELKEWDEQQFKRVVEVMMRMDRLMCLSWIRLAYRLPDQLKQRLRHIFCPSIMLHKLSRRGPKFISVRFIEPADQEQNLQEIDYSEVVVFAGKRFFIERHGMTEELTRTGTTCCVWNSSIRCPAGDDAFILTHLPYSDAPLVQYCLDVLDPHKHKDYKVVPIDSGEGVRFDGPRKFVNSAVVVIRVSFPDIFLT